MGVRTGKGDNGTTDLSFRKRISKDSIEIEALGDLDELNSFIGLARSKTRSRKEKALLENIQNTLFRISSEMVVGSKKRKKMGELLKQDDVEWIKTIVFQLSQKVRLDSCFYIPGDNELSALLDVARAVARRAERRVVSLFNKGKLVNDHLLVYLNCLSDAFFLLAREKMSKEKTVGKVKRKRKT